PAAVSCPVPPAPPTRPPPSRRAVWAERDHLPPPRQPVRHHQRPAPAGPGRHRHRHLPHGGGRRTVLPAGPVVAQMRKCCYAPAVTVPDSMIDEAARRFALLSDPTRLRIVAVLLEREPMTVTELSDSLGIAAPNVSQHLARLSAGRLVG